MCLDRGCRWLMSLAGLVLAAGQFGCPSQGGPERGITRAGPGDFAGRRLLDVDLAGVQPVGERVFRQYFRIDSEASRLPYLLVSRPLEVTAPADPERVRDVLAVSRNRRRQIAQLRMVQEGAVVLVQCRVQTQRLDTPERAAFARSSNAGSDLPTDTPIDRQDASATKTREEWVNVGRDRHAEDLILDAIVQAFAETRPAE